MSGPTSDKQDADEIPPSEAHPQVAWGRFHLRLGWWSVLVFLSWGIVVEGFVAFGWEYYGEPGTEMTRLMWRLAHVHGALLGMVHLAFGTSIFLATAWTSSTRRIASYCLTWAGVLLPLGFLLGGLFAADGDPSLGVFLVPLGALLLFTAVLLTARGISSL